MLDFNRAFVVKMETILDSWRDVADKGQTYDEARKPRTVNTLLSDISAFALSGWVCVASLLAGAWLRLKLRLHRD